MPNVGELTFEESVGRQFGLRCVVSDQALHNYIFDNMWYQAYTLDVPPAERGKIVQRDNLCHFRAYVPHASVFSLPEDNLDQGAFVGGAIVPNGASAPVELTNGNFVRYGAVGTYQEDFGHGLTTILYYGNVFSNGLDEGVGQFDVRYYPNNDITEAAWVMEPILRSIFNSEAPAWHNFYNRTHRPSSVTTYFISDANLKNDPIAQLGDPLVFGTFPTFLLFRISFQDAEGDIISRGFEDGSIIRVAAVEEDNIADLSYFDVRMTRIVNINAGEKYSQQVARILSRPNRPIPLTQTPTRLKLTGAPTGGSFEVWARDMGTSSIAVTLDQNDRPIQQNVANILTRYNTRIKPRQYVLLPNDDTGWVIDNVRQVGRRKFMELELRR